MRDKSEIRYVVGARRQASLHIKLRDEAAENELSARDGIKVSKCER